MTTRPPGDRRTLATKLYREHIHGIYVHTKQDFEEQNEGNRRGQIKKRMKSKKKESEPNPILRSGRRLTPEWTMMLFAGTITPMIWQVDGPTERRHDETRRKTRLDEGRDSEQKKKNSSHMSSWWAKDDTRKGGQSRKDKYIVTNPDKISLWLDQRGTCGEAAGGRVAEYGGVPSTWQGTGQHNRQKKSSYCNCKRGTR